MVHTQTDSFSTLFHSSYFYQMVFLIVKKKTRQAMYVERNIEARPCKYCCSAKGTSITYSVCVCVSVALGIQHVKSMHRIILASVACLRVSYFSTYSYKRHDFLKKKNVIEYKVSVWVSCTIFFFETFLLLKTIKRDIINIHKSSSKVSVIRVRFQLTF